ncbi:uncharacterized protein TRAVEDRAFT_62406 [Trametes versicolor FP-101664 SS1]|uniref:uncharacterized protein n=1 Tax=Trametes versicolor (strain FP-101664) TaxID=717944 RepID=UPI00046238E9|nr:uncharacterized protein TRAVEDRAFT_62406 [Trametes versicolor FP-101664 SS1]EIW65182.1 hypothetical protein TRAVEDRAFT_62406 [Trametes versicolor FP-101664 SS1]
MATIIALEQALATAASSVIPVLGHVLQAALLIAQTVEKIKDTKDACKRLSERAVDISLKVSDLLQGRDSHDEIGPDLEEFLCFTVGSTLQGIQGLIEGRLKKSRFAFAREHGEIAAQVKELNDKLEDAMILLQIGVTYHGNQSLGGKLRYVILRISQADERQRKAHNQQQAHNKEIIARLDRMEQLRGVMRAAAGDGHAYEPPLLKGGAVRKYGTRSPHKQPESTDPLSAAADFDLAQLHTALYLIGPFKAWLAEQQHPPRWLKDIMENRRPPREYAQSDSPPPPPPNTPGGPATNATGAGVRSSRLPDTHYCEPPTGENSSATFRNKNQFTFASNGTTWLRRHSVQLRPGTTLTLRLDLPSNFFSATIPDRQPATVAKRAISVMAYTLETILETVDTTQQTSEAPLWFFLLEHDNLHHHSLFDRRIPWGFWSTDENPTAIPSNIVFCPPLRSRKSAFPFMWQQKLGARSFSIRARVAMECLALAREEGLAFEQSQRATYQADGRPKARLREPGTEHKDALFLVVAPSFIVIPSLMLAPCLVVLSGYGVLGDTPSAQKSSRTRKDLTASLKVA